MKLKIYRPVFSAAFLLMQLAALGQMSLDLEYRPRFEAWRGYRALPSDTLKDPLFYLSQRTRLSYNLNTDLFEIGLAVQDVRLWGDETLYSKTGVFGSNASIDLYQGWAKVSPFRNFWIKAGRQELNYDDQRLLSLRNWNQAGITYDALLLGYEKNSLKIHAAFSWNNNLYSLVGISDYPDKMRTLSMLWLSKNLGDYFRVSAIGLLTGFQAKETPEVIYLKATTGVNLFYNKGTVKIHAAGYYQAGKHKDGRDVGAFAVIGELSYKKNWLNLIAGINYLSGQNQEKYDPGTSGKYQLFDIFYGARHKYYGYLDYFNDPETSTSGGGLNDIYLRFKPSISKKHTIELTGHYFALAGKIVDPILNVDDAFLGKFLGTEVDFVYEYQPFEFMILHAGFAWMDPAESMEKIQNTFETESPAAWFSYLQFTLRPTLFKTEKKIELKK